MRQALIGVALIAVAACSQPAEKEAAVDVPTPGMASTTTAAAATPETAYSGPIPMPIIVGSDGPQMDACGTYARVVNLNSAGDNYLSVRDAPSTSTKERDRLDARQGVSVCASANGWSGVVYAKEGDEVRDCGTGSPVASQQPYRGPCRQGWVDSRYLEMIAG